jgi:hypothetical protein
VSCRVADCMHCRQQVLDASTLDLHRSLLSTCIASRRGTGPTCVILGALRATAIPGQEQQYGGRGGERHCSSNSSSAAAAAAVLDRERSACPQPAPAATAAAWWCLDAVSRPLRASHRCMHGSVHCRVLYLSSWDCDNVQLIPQNRFIQAAAPRHSEMLSKKQLGLRPSLGATRRAHIAPILALRPCRVPIYSRAGVPRAQVGLACCAKTLGMESHCSASFRWLTRSRMACASIHRCLEPAGRPNRRAGAARCSALPRCGAKRSGVVVVPRGARRGAKRSCGACAAAQGRCWWAIQSCGHQCSSGGRLDAAFPSLLLGTLRALWARSRANWRDS